ncbi:MAG: helix-turn-helix transcriptional regulator [Arcobacteraceae bacterium]
MLEYFKNEEQLIQRLEVVRNKLGLQQQDFAKEIGISKQAYTNIIKKRRNVNWEELFFVCKKFQIDGNWLFFGTGDIQADTTILNPTINLIEEVNHYFLDDKFSHKILLEKVFEKIIQKLHQNTLLTKIIGENRTPIKFLLRILANEVQKEYYSRLEFINEIEKIESENKLTKKNLKKIIENLSEEELFLITKYRANFIKIYLSELDFADKVFFKEFKKLSL